LLKFIVFRLATTAETAPPENTPLRTSKRTSKFAPQKEGTQRREKCSEKPSIILAGQYNRKGWPRDFNAAVTIAGLRRPRTPQRMTEELPQPPESTPVVVLDTNVILEAWVFGNSDSAAILEAVSAHTLRWFASHEMRSELIHVLNRGLGPRWPASWEALQERWDGLAIEHQVDSNRPAHWPRCTDQDDQKFIDFALRQQARWLISRDRAVLKLASRCARLGLTVVDPTGWREIWLAESDSAL
jgi:putative PIN family toxin of toxin-antitoxin system